MKNSLNEANFDGSSKNSFKTEENLGKNLENYWDNLRNHHIVIGEVFYHGKTRKALVAYDKIGDDIEAVTIHPVTDDQIKQSKVSYDKKKDILYILLRGGVEERFEDISENITVEYDAKDRPIGIEIFNASKILPNQKSSSPTALLG